MNLATLADRPAKSSIPQRVRFNSERERVSFEHGPHSTTQASASLERDCSIEHRLGTDQSSREVRPLVYFWKKGGKNVG
jgi:hypothetical protein